MARLFRIGSVGTARVEAFSDGVMAVAITLLILDIHMPPASAVGDMAIWMSLMQTAPAVGAWAVSFVFILVFWVSHHMLFASLARADRGLFWLNGIFLLAICFTPFATSVSVLHPWSQPATFLLSASMLLTSLAFSAMRWYATMHAELLRPGTLRDGLRTAMRWSLVAPGLYGVACLSAFVWPPMALVIQLTVPFLYAVPLGMTQPEHARDQPAPRAEDVGGQRGDEAAPPRSGRAPAE